MKKTWVRPNLQMQLFEANEYVAACWGVACDCNAANDVEREMEIYHPTHLSHNVANCGQQNNQVLVDRNNDNVPEYMKEVGTNGLGELRCELFTNDSYTTGKNIQEVRPGDWIYWTTSAEDRTWHHQGRVLETAPGHPNRS